MHATTVSATAHVGARRTDNPLPASPDSRTWKLSTSGVIRSEWIKLMSLRSIRLTLLATVLASLGLSVLLAWGLGDEFVGAPKEGLITYLLTVSTFASSFLALIFGVLGVFAISSEYSSGMILSTLTAVPRRSPVFGAKALVLSAVAGVTAFALVLGGLAIAVAFMPASASALVHGQVVSGVLGTVAYLVLIALFAYGVSTLVRSTAGGIAIVAGVTFVLPIGFQILSMMGWEWVLTVLDYLPASLGNVLGTGIAPSAPEMTGPGFWQALIAMVVWAVVFLVPGLIAIKQRDAK